MESHPLFLFHSLGGYRKVVCKCRGFCAIFQLFGVDSIQVWLFFEGGLYAMFRVYAKPVKAAWYMHRKNATARMLLCFKFGMHKALCVRKAEGFLTTSTLGRYFQAAAFI